MTLKEQIIIDLADNYNQDDGDVLEMIIEDVTNQAKAFSNRSSADGLSFEIKTAVKALYLQRGKEDVVSYSGSGRSQTYVDVMQKLLANIVKGNKRVVR